MSLRLGAATLNQTPLAWKSNAENISKAINKAKAEGVDILCLPELCITSYGCQDMFLASWVSAKAVDTLIELLPETSGIAVTLGFPYWVDGKVYNCVALVHDQQIIGISAKQNLPGEGVYYEPRWFQRWPSGSKSTVKIADREVPFGDLVYDLMEIRIAFEICEDAWVEDRPACNYVDENIDLVLNPSASHFEYGKVKVREDLMIKSSAEFDCTYIYANQLGNEAGRLIYEGDLIIAQKGDILARGKHLSLSDLELISCEVDFKGENPALEPLKTRSKEEDLHSAATLALLDYLRKSGARGYTLSLSGGADSAMCAVLVGEMVKRGVSELGEAEFLKRINLDIEGSNVIGQVLTCVYQATKNSSDTTQNAASSLAEEIGAKYLEWNVDDEIAGAINKVQTGLGKEFSWESDDLALQNIQARMRSPFAWLLANAESKLLLTTSNRSEGDVGYATMDGDTAGGLAPIADLDKVFIRQWLGWAKDELGYKSLSNVLDQQPTAELRPLSENQTDEADLMSYQLLHEIELLALQEKLAPLEVWNRLQTNGWDKEESREGVIKFFRMWSYSQWKRERLAPSFHFDHFNIDPKTWMRFPILNSGFRDEITELLNS